MRSLNLTCWIRAATIIFVCIVATALASAQGRNKGSTGAETYDSATIDAEGQLVIAKTGGQRVLVRKDPEQTTFSPPAISSARTAVAAQAMFGNCCTSYDIPLQIVTGPSSGRNSSSERIWRLIGDLGSAAP